MTMKGLGRLFDVAPVIAPLDLATARTGLPVSLVNAGGVTFLIIKGVGTAGQDPVITLREAQDGAGTGEQDLATISEWHSKTDTANNTLSGNETWARFTNGPAASPVPAATADLDAAGGNAEDQAIVSLYVDASDLSDGFTHVTLDIASVGASAQLGAVVALLHDLKVGRSPVNLAATQ